MDYAEDCVQGIVVTRRQGSTSPTPGVATVEDWWPQFAPIAVPKTTFSDPAWIFSPLSAKLGIPIQIVSHPLAEDSQDHNYGAQLLCLKHNHQDPAFGKSNYEPLQGVKILARTDGKHLTVKELQALMTYIQVELAEMWFFSRMHHADRAGAAQRIAERRVTSEAFAANLERHSSA